MGLISSLKRKKSENFKKLLTALAYSDSCLSTQQSVFLYFSGFPGSNDYFSILQGFGKWKQGKNDSKESRALRRTSSLSQGVRSVSDFDEILGQSRKWSEGRTQAHWCPLVIFLLPIRKETRLSRSSREGSLQYFARSVHEWRLVRHICSGWMRARVSWHTRW